MSIGETGERLRRSTVQVRSGPGASGSGVLWDASGTIVTNAHVVRSGDLTIELWDGRIAKARLGGRDVRRDLAILHVEKRIGIGLLEPARAGDSDRIRVGELVIAVGNPFGFTGALSTGVVHGICPVRGIGGQAFIQTTARLAPGNSGGPLANAAGDVIGINTMLVSSGVLSSGIASGGLGLAVPANAVRRLLTAGSPVELGVTVRPVRIPGPDRGIAWVVLGVAPGSPADYASLRVGDALIGSGGKRFSTSDDLYEALDSDRLLTLQFLRGGDPKRREVTVRLDRGLNLGAAA
jgi:serine protease Do